jgi:hypothetical protein
LHVILAERAGLFAATLPLPSVAPALPALDAVRRHARVATAPRRLLQGPVRLAPFALAQLLATAAPDVLVPGRPDQRVDDLGRPRRPGRPFVLFRRRVAHLPPGTLPPGDALRVAQLDSIVAAGGPIQLVGAAEAGRRRGEVRLALDPDALRAALATPERRGATLVATHLAGADYHLPELDLGGIS